MSAWDIIEGLLAGWGFVALVLAVGIAIDTAADIRKWGRF